MGRDHAQLIFHKHRKRIGLISKNLILVQSTRVPLSLHIYSALLDVTLVACRLLSGVLVRIGISFAYPVCI